MDLGTAVKELANLLTVASSALQRLAAQNDAQAEERVELVQMLEEIRNIADRLRAIGERL